MSNVAIAALIIGFLLVWFAINLLERAHEVSGKAIEIYYEGIHHEEMAAEKYRQAAALLQMNEEVRQQVDRRTKELKAVHREIGDRINGEDWSIPED